MIRQQTAIFATLWSIIERFSTQLASFIIGIILARILTPNDYGIIGLTTIFISISNVFIDSGFANGIIRKIDRTEKDLSTALIFNIGVGIIVYIILYLSSPTIAIFFNEPLLDTLIKIVGLNVLLNSLCIVQTAILTARLDVKGQAIINLCAQIPSGLLAIYLAYKHYGIYALALQSVCSSLLRVILLWIYTRWKPCTGFSYNSFKYLWGFGHKLLSANLIGTLFNEIYSVLIGKFISKQDLGYYAKSSSLNLQIDSIFTGTIQKIALPILSKYQLDNSELSKKYREFLCYLVMALSLLIAILFSISDKIIILLWTEKWQQCIIIFQLLIVGTIFNPLSNLSLSLLQVLGHSNTILKLELPKKIIYTIFIGIGFYYGLLGLVIARLLINITGAFINMWATKKVINYSYKFQLTDIFKYIILGAFISFLSIITFNFSNSILNILGQIFTISFMYCFSLLIIKDKTFYRLLTLVKTKII